MELALIIIGIALIASGFKGTEHELGTQLSNDLTGTDGFVIWIAAFGALYLIGKIPGLNTPVKYFIALIFVVIFLGNPDFFSNLTAGFSAADSAGPAPSQPIATGSGSSGSGSSDGGGLGGAIGAAASVASVIGL